MKRYIIHILLASTVLVLAALSSCTEKQKINMVTSTMDTSWQETAFFSQKPSTEASSISIDTHTEYQTIDGFGTCFNEMGWQALRALSPADRAVVMKELFATDFGANMTICRMPIATNDFSIDPYFYCEKDGDFEMNSFSIAHDHEYLIPFIKSALSINPEITIWASPWSPPSWMKHNKDYHAKGEKEGTDLFIMKDEYLKAYALYFSKFIDAYKHEGITIDAVMPQNEFNSAQVFPSCLWTAKSLAVFIGQYLGPAMKEKDVDIYMGTMERPNALLVDTILQDAKSRPFLKGVGFQWAGKTALPVINKKYPNLKMIQTEQECGSGKNNWAEAMHAWDLMKWYFDNGVSVYDYWNTALVKKSVSRWGWAQNSMITVDTIARTYTYNPEFYIMKHFSHFVKKGAKRVDLNGSYTEAVAFKNPDASIVLVATNKEDEELPVQIDIDGESSFAVTLKPQSISTLVL